MRHRLEYVAVRALIGLVRVLPDAVVRGCGTLLGLAFYTIDRAHRRIAERNLAVAFPARPPGERRTIMRGAFTHFGRVLFEILKFSTLSHRAMLARVEFDGEVFDSSVCHMAHFRDPDGNVLMLHRRYAPYRDGSLP